MENDSKIEFFENGTILEEEKKQNRKILGIVFTVLAIAVVVLIMSVISTKSCFDEATKKTDELLRIGTSMVQNGYTGNIPNREQTLNYALGECVKNNPLATKYIPSFSINFLLETFLIFMFLWLVSKQDKTSSLIRASVVAFYFSVLSALGTSFSAFMIIWILAGFGVVSKMLHYDFIKRLFFVVGLLTVQYTIMFLLLKVL